MAALFFYRRRKAQARNAILLQNQQARPNQWGPPPPGGSYYNTSPPGVGGYPNNGYPMYPNSTNGPQPFQPGYQGGYTGDFGPKEYGAGPNATPLQEPPRSYDPSQPHSQYAVCILRASYRELDVLILLYSRHQALLLTILPQQVCQTNHLVTAAMRPLQDRHQHNRQEHPTTRTHTSLLTRRRRSYRWN